MTATDDDGLQTLLRRAGRRPLPPDEVMSAVYQHTRRAWEAQVRQRNALQRQYAWAAGLVALVLASWGAWNLYPHRVMATANAGQGLLITHTLWHPFAERLGGELYAGDAVETLAVGARLRRADGVELRLAGHTRLAFPSPGDVRLWRGRLYVQTNDPPGTQNLVVITDLGRVEHLGTQLLVDREDDALLVAVRDGRVAVHYGQHETFDLQAGQVAHVNLRGELRRWDVAAFDGIWDWADTLATPLAIDGQSLYAVLSRIAQESGMTLRFSSARAEAEARRLLLHGAPLELPARNALDAVLATTSLSATADGREILVSAR